MKDKKKAFLVLEDGAVFEGTTFGADKYVEGEVVFNTGITGYQEVLTDPSYAGQIVTMTYPQIGNYGYIEEDSESDRIQVRGFIVKEHCDYPNNYRNEGTLDEHFKKKGIVGIQGIDTRAVTKRIRNHGAMKGFITTEDLPVEKLVEKVKNVEDISKLDLIGEVTTKEEYILEGNGKNIGIVDFGMKANISKILNSMDHKLTVMPATSTAEYILSKNFDLILLSNGPGDPERYDYAIEMTKGLIGNVPLCGICMGHQIISLALGMKTFKLKFGHRGGNHPVHNLQTDKVDITTQNHGYAVKKENPPAGVDITHINLNDMTVQGIRKKDANLYSVQFHPEAGPGPSDSKKLFGEFIELIK